MTRPIDERVTRATRFGRWQIACVVICVALGFLLGAIASADEIPTHSTRWEAER